MNLYMREYDLEDYRKRVDGRRVRIPKPILSDDLLDVLNRKIMCVGVGSILSLKYYKDGAILHITGEVLVMSRSSRYLKIGRTIIRFEDMIEIY